MSRRMQIKTVTWEIKNVDEAGYIEGLAAAYGNVDFGGDKILPGAFSKSLSGRASIPMLWKHDDNRPVGSWSKFEETDEGLMSYGKITTKSRDGADAYELAKDRAFGGLSIGYHSIKDKMVEKVRELHELYLHEVSLVPVGMNPKALVTSMKDIAGDGKIPTLPEFEEFLREVGFSRTQAKAIAGKGLSHLLQREVGDAPDEMAEFYRHLTA